MKLIAEVVESVQYLSEADENGKKNYFIEGFRPCPAFFF